MRDVTQLLEDAGRGDPKAVDRLYRLTEPELRNLALHWIRRKRAKERVRTTDVIDRAFIRLMRFNPPGWQGWQHRGAFYKLASRFIMCLVIDLMETPQNHLPIDGPGKGPEGLSLPSVRTIRQALEELEQDVSEEHRVIVELFFFGECTLDEIAEQLSISRDVVFRKKKVALAYLREKLKDSFPDFGRSPAHSAGGQQCPP